MIGRFLLLAYTVGPAAAIPYASTHISMHWIFLSLFIAYTAPLPLLFFILDRFHYPSATKKHLIHRMIGKPVKKVKDKNLMNKIYCSFEGKWGYLGHYFGLGSLAFAFGFLWVAILAYVLKLPRTRSYLAIGIGNIIGLIFWIFIIVQTKGFIKPKRVIIIVLLVTFLLFLYGEARKRKILKKLKNTNKEILSRIKSQTTN